ncbi:hypothetical protein VII00023_06187 [Vibrio ichthyoenteri ATCC 700023]|uniref:Uncharacterized protein n=1 Tax=Vibrio ichthyoenteri ATCC 700023 TaxID=870968 RepID=F9S1V6_9VIBR|nr:hypothetical protein [Vibrio ichthyoenteri]EGU41196.1 hypothetical protein VII00023_06187 [Vibrio ichthyoenteri ATCC 700023]
MNPYAKTAIKCAVLTLWSATIAVGVLLAYEQWRPSIVQTDLDALEQRINAVVLDNATTQTAALNQLSGKLDALEEELTSLELGYGALTHRQETNETEISNLDDKLSAEMSEGLSKLEARLTTKLNSTSSRTRTIVEPPRKTVKATKPKPVIEVPFELYDVQKRGLTYLAIVGKPGATHLSQLSAVQEGQSYQSWRLIRVEPGRVELQKAADRIELEVRS